MLFNLLKVRETSDYIKVHIHWEPLVSALKERCITIFLSRPSPCHPFSVLASEMAKDAENVDGWSFLQIDDYTFGEVRYTFSHPWLKWFLTNMHVIKSGHHLIL